MTTCNMERENYFYLSGLYLMLLRHNIPVIGMALYWVGAFFCFLYLIYGGTARRNQAYTKWVLAYVLFFVLSISWSVNWKTSVFVFSFHLIPIFSLTFATLKYLRDYDRLNNILTAVFFCALAMLCYLAMNIEEFLIGVRLGNSLNDPDAEDKIWNANVIGMTFCFALYAGWIVFMNSTSRIRKFFYVIVAVLMTMAVLLTGSRKTLLMLFIPISYFLYKKARSKFIISLLGLAVFSALSYYLIMNVEMFYSTIGSRVEDLITILSGDATGREDDSRYYLTMYGLEWWQNNPILGIGINCFRVLSSRTSMFWGKGFYAHNNYVELLVDVGIIGTIIYYSGYYYLLKESIIIKSHAASWVFALLIVVLVLDVAYVSYYDLNNQLLLAILFGVIYLEKNKLLLRDYEAS